jgi:hypothetical protein
MTDESVSMIGGVTLEFRHEGHVYVMTTSGDRETLTRVSETSEVIEGVEVPKWIEVTTSGGADPDMRVRVEIRDGAPRVVELTWISQPHQSEIRPKQLRNVDLAKLAIDLFANTISKLPPRPDGQSGSFVEQRRQLVDEIRQAKRLAQKFVERQRRPREQRRITDSFLRSVAEVYRENIHAAPTKAVAQACGVQNRMASTYVQKARRKGYLPPTKRGQKKA